MGEMLNLEGLKKAAFNHPDKDVRREAGRKLVQYYIRITHNILKHDNERIEAGFGLVAYLEHCQKASQLRAIAEDKRPYDFGGFHERVKIKAWQSSKAAILCCVTGLDLKTVKKKHRDFISRTSDRPGRLYIVKTG